MSWPVTRLVVLAMAVFTAMLVTLLIIAGAWPVAPFAGLEVVALAAGLYWCACRGQEREVISIYPATVAVERGRYRPQQRCEFARPWAQVALRASGRPDRSRLVIGCGGRAVEVGACLDEEERRRLARELRRALAAVPGDA